MRLVDEVLDHLLGDVDVRDHAVAERPDGLDAGRRLAHHQLGVAADRLHAPDSLDIFQRHHRGLVEHDALAAHVDDRVHGAQIDRHVVRREPQEAREKHGAESSNDARRAEPKRPNRTR